MQQVNNSERCSVYIDGKFAFGISQLDLLKFSLKTGQELTNAEIRDILNAVDETKCQDYANSLVCARMYTKIELHRKLKVKKFSDEVINTVISRLSEYGYVDDKTYAQTYIEETKHKYGVFKIRQKLFEKGVPEIIITECLQDLDNIDTAIKHLKLKLRNKSVDSEEKQKLLRFLAQKGFAYDEAHEAIRRYMEEIDGFYDE